MKKLTTDEFIIKARLKHGDKYSYNNVVYISAKYKIKILCLNHGEFSQIPHNHLTGQGCPKCGDISTRDKKISNTDKFIKKAKLIHDDKYDYSLAEYINNTKSVKIICKKHTIFEQQPSNHLQGKGCPICGNTKKLTTEKFIEKANLKHNNKYKYTLTEYVSANLKVKIICTNHGIFEQRPGAHLKGSGCLKCKGSLITEIKTKTADFFIKYAKLIHGNIYDYSMVNYVHNAIKIKIICPIEGHGEFEQTPNNHLQGHGCIKCSSDNLSKIATNNSYGWSLTGWNNKVINTNNATPRLYVLKCYNDSESFIKIGITMRDIKTRYRAKSQMPYKFEVLLDFISTSELVFKAEKLANKKFNFIKYLPKLKFNGISECYNIKNKKEIINYCKSIF